MSSAEDSDSQPLNRKPSVGQSNKVKPRELKAIQRGYSQIMSSIDLEKQSKAKQGAEEVEDREARKARLYFENIQKKERDLARKKKLKEQREQKKTMVSTSDRRSDCKVIKQQSKSMRTHSEEAGSSSQEEHYVPASVIRRGSQRRGQSQYRGRGRRGRYGRPSRGRRP